MAVVSFGSGNFEGDFKKYHMLEAPSSSYYVSDTSSDINASITDPNQIIEWNQINQTQPRHVEPQAQLLHPPPR